MTAHIRALEKAKIALMSRSDSAFFTTVCFSLKHVWTDELPTAATDGKKIYFSPQFFMSLDEEERVFLLLHESMHVAYLHMDRVHERDRKKWNIAADHVINLQLKARGFKMPAKGLADPQYEGKSTEEVYALLPDDPTQECPWDDLKGGDASGIPSEELRAEVKEILVRASIQSKMAGDKPGSIPGDIEIFIQNLLDPKLPWQRILQKYLTSFAKSDYSFRKPNRRFFPKYHLPSLWGQGLGEIAIFVDISGSVSDEEFHHFVSETASILKMMKPERILLGQFDTEIKSVTSISTVRELLNIRFTGRGGTLIHPVLEWANKNQPQALLVFSDGGFGFYEYPCQVDTLFLIHDNPGFEAPFGKVVHYEM